MFSSRKDFALAGYRLFRCDENEKRARLKVQPVMQMQMMQQRVVMAFA